MAASRRERLQAISERLYRLLLAAYPPEFRAEYGTSMAQVFRDCSRAAYQRSGNAGVLRLWLNTLGDTALTALAEHLTDVIQRRGANMATSRGARIRQRGELFGENFQTALTQVVDDEALDYRGKAAEAQDEGTERDVRLADEPAVVRIAHTIIAQAIKEGASEIHVEPGSKSLDVHFGIEGTMQKVLRLPKRVQRKLLARYKHMAEMRIAEHAVPQEGRIAIRHQGKDYDLSAHSQPVENGERVVMSIIAKE